LLVYGGWDLDYDVAFQFPWVLSLSFPDAIWSSLDPDRSDGRYPDATAAQSQVFDARRDRLVVFGGLGFLDGSSDRWYLQFTNGEALHAWPLASTVSAGAAHVTWQVVDQPEATLTVERMETGGGWSALGTVLVDENHQATFDDGGLRRGWRYSYRLRIDSPSGSEHSGLITLDIPGSTGIDFAGAWPNPARGSEMAIWFSLPTAGTARVALRDLHGRLVWSHALSANSSGPQVVRPDVRLPAGLYFAEVVAAGQSARRKITILP
jgi:hypothetical protein